MKALVVNLILVLTITLAYPISFGKGVGGRSSHQYHAPKTATSKGLTHPHKAGQKRNTTNQSSNKSVRVKGYYRKNGTYVQPHRRSHPNKSKSDNWSTKGNVNPDTGKAGTKDP